MPMRISVSGLVGIDVDGDAVDLGGLGRVSTLFLVYLVWERHRPVAKDDLAEVLWGDDLPRSWDQMLRGNASKLRTILASAGLEPASVLTSARGSYQLKLPPDAMVDVEVAAAAIEQALRATRAGEADEAYRTAAEAVAVAARGFLPGSPGIWVEQRQAELREMRLTGLEVVAQAAVAQGKWAEAVGGAEEAVALEPFRESAYQLLMAAHRGAGNPGAALRAYERCRRTLAEELGVSPSAATERAYLSLLDDDRSAVAVDDSEVPLPAALAASADSVLVGRKDESDRLRAALQRATTHGRQAVLIAGEPGIGKTALVSTFGRETQAGGAVVLYGRCDEEMGVAYQPFVEALGHYVAHCPLAELRAHVGVHGAQLSRIAPVLLLRLPDAPPLEPPSEGDRHRLFEAASHLLTQASQRAPLVLVLDDLHWAAPPTLSLLRHLLRSRAGSFLVIGTYRHTEIGSDHPLWVTLADLRREPGVERTALDGLDADGVSALVEWAEGHALGPADQALARALHARTAGNPFFVGEFLRHLTEIGAVYRREGAWSYYEDPESLGVPEGVRDVLARRLGRLSAPANRALTVASIVGAEFDLPLLERVAGPASADSTLDGLDEAVAAHVVVELGSGRYRFAHALVRDTVYSGLTGTRRARLHHQVGQALTSLPGARDSRLPALAHHFAQAATDGAAIEAGEYALAAAKQAFDKSAWEDVLSFVETGLGALSPADPTHLGCRFELLLIRYETLVVVAEVEHAAESLLDAVETARRSGSPDAIARALTLYLFSSGMGDPLGTAWAEEALGRLGDDAPHLRARLLAALAIGRRQDPSVSELDTRAALTLARQSGDDDAVYASLVARKMVLAESPHAREWLAVEEELLAIGPRAQAVVGSRWMHSLGQGRAKAGLVLGDRDAFESVLDRLDQQFRETQKRGGAWNTALWRGALALLDGRFGEVEAMASAALDFNAAQVLPWTVQMCKLALEQGRGHEFKGEVLRGLTAMPGNTALSAMLALVCAERGEHEEAMQLVAELAGDGCILVRRGTAAMTFAYLAEVVSLLGEAESASTIYERFRPWSGLAAFSGSGTHCPGAVDRFLGQLATTRGQWDQAERHYEAALAFETGLRSPPLLARTRYWYARMLVERGRAGDDVRARELLASAVETAERLGMSRLAVQAMELA